MNMRFGAGSLEFTFVDDFDAFPFNFSERQGLNSSLEKYTEQEPKKMLASSWFPAENVVVSRFTVILQNPTHW